MATSPRMKGAALQRRIDEFADDLERYLSGQLSHAQLHDRIERHFAAWEADPAGQASPYVSGEPAYWCAIWTAQHLADEEHWSDGLPQKDLAFLLPLLRGRRDLPDGWEGKRPSDAPLTLPGRSSF